MFLLANSFALGSLAGGAVVTLLSCFLIRDAEAFFLLVWAGYAVVGCLSAALYAPALKLLAFGRREVTSVDRRRAFITAAVCAVGEYLFAVAARTHEYDRVLLFTVPLGAALVDAIRVRGVAAAIAPRPAQRAHPDEP
jgi:hypothetical protein